MNKIKHINIKDLPSHHVCKHEAYEHHRQNFVTTVDGEARDSLVAVYTLPPGKSNYPYHYHKKNEETFYIISGEGLLKTPEGEKMVSAGDLLFFPTGPEGAHKLTNCSETENLVYIDFDVAHDLEVCIYPDTNKVGVIGKLGLGKFYPQDANVDYYEGE